MRLLVPWGVDSTRLKTLLETHAGCPHCGCPVVRLVRHVISDSHTQCWVSCIKCSAKGCGDGPQPHVPDHPRLHAYPIWRADMTAALEPEEFAEIQNARPRPLSWSELHHTIVRSARLMTEIRAQDRIGIAFGYECEASDIRALGSLFVPGSYVAARGDNTAWLMRVEADRLQASTPFRTNGRTHWGAPIVVPHAPQHP